MEKIGFGRVKRFKVSNPSDVEHQIVLDEMPLNEAYKMAAHLNRIGRGQFYAYVETRYIGTFQVFPVRPTDRKGQRKEPIQFDNPKDFKPKGIIYTGAIDGNDDKIECAPIDCMVDEWHFPATMPGKRQRVLLDSISYGKGGAMFTYKGVAINEFMSGNDEDYKPVKE
jgi:hypothetical protein